MLASTRIDKKLVDGTTTPDLISLRDRAIIGTLIYTTARARAIARFRRKHFIHDGALWTLRFAEKGGKSREIPVRHDDLEKFIVEYVDAVGFHDPAGGSPLFRSADRRCGRLSAHRLIHLHLFRCRNCFLVTLFDIHKCIPLLLKLNSHDPANY